MNLSELSNKAFRMIQADKALYQQWNDAKTETDRKLMLLEQAYTIGYTDGMMGRSSLALEN